MFQLPLRCRCGRVRGVANDVSPSTGLRFVWWMRGLGRPTPFFDDDTNAPRAVPHVL